MNIPVLCLVGRSNTGKTTLIEKLIPILRSRGIRIATIKHHNRDFEIDREGKDTYRHKKAGARLSMIVSPKKLALVEDLEDDLSLEVILDRYVRDVDLVIVEGYKEEPAPKIEVYACQPDLTPLAADDGDILAIVSDKPFNPAVCPELSRALPTFLRNQVEQISLFVMEKLLPLRR